MSHRSSILLLVGLLAAATGSPVAAAPLVYFDTMTSTDYAYFGTGGLRDNGTGSIVVSGIAGPVTRAIIHWHGPSNSPDPSAGAQVAFAGTNVTGTHIGTASDNCWSYANSQAHYADVTALVTGDGAHSLTDFLGPRFNVNGVSLEVF